MSAPQLHPVLLLQLPVQVWAASQEHHDELLREFALMTAGLEDRDTGAAPVPVRLLRLVEQLTASFAGSSDEQRRRLFAAAGVAAERETEALAALGLTAGAFANFGKLLGGTRRHNQVYPEGLSADWEPAGLRLAFTLPSGCYATVLLREVMKPAGDLDGGDTESDE